MKTDSLKMTIVGPQIIRPLSSVRVGIGRRVCMKCLFTGEPKPSIKWFHNNHAVKQVANISKVYEVIDQMLDEDLIYDQSQQVFGASLNIEPVSSDHAGIYKFTAINEGGSASTSANVIILDEDVKPGLFSFRLFHMTY